MSLLQLFDRESTIYSTKAYIALDRTAPSAKKYTRQKIEFMFIGDDFSDSRGANWSEQSIIGRSENYLSYANSTNRAVTLNLNFFALNSLIDDVVRPVKWLQSLALPNNQENFTLPPPPVLVHLGQALTGQYGPFRGVVMNVDVTWGHPFDLRTMTPYNAQVSITLKGANIRPESGAEFANTFERSSGFLQALMDSINLPPIQIPTIPGLTDTLPGVDSFKTFISSKIGRYF